MFVASAIMGIAPVKRFRKSIGILLDIYSAVLATMVISGASWNLYGKKD
jgi:hypothetical protein